MLQTRSVLPHSLKYPLSLLTAVLGISLSVEASLPTETGLIASGKIRCLNNDVLIKYLMLKQVDRDFASGHEDRRTPETLEVSISESQFQALCDLILDCLNTEVSYLLSSNLFNDSESDLNLNSDTTAILASLCAVTFAITSHAKVRRSSKASVLRNDALKLLHSTTKLILIHHDREPLVLVILSVLGPLLSPSRLRSGGLDMATSGCQVLATDFGPAFWLRLETSDGTELVDEEMMETGRSSQSQTTMSKLDNQDPRFTWDWLSVETSSSAWLISMKHRIYLASLAGDLDKFEPPSPWLVPHEFVEYLTKLPVREFVLSQKFVTELLDANVFLNIESTELLFDYVGHAIGDHDFRRTEALITLCVKIMTGLADTWINADGDLGGMSKDIYKWLIDTIIKQKAASPFAFLQISRLLRRVIELRPDYLESLPIPSPRTSLFQILEAGTASLKYELGMQLSSLFGLFILKEHDHILDDVMSSIPMQSDWIEGTALRIFVLSHLGSSWSTLIRRCIYAVVEAPALVPASARFAKACLEHLARALDLSSSRDLFKLFMSQILYTWLNTQTLESIPYSIFGYDSLVTLASDVQHEITAQVVMRGRESEASALSNLFGQPYPSLLEASFAKSAAYCIARDAAVAPDVDPQAADGAKRLRKVLGKEQFVSLISRRFPEILASFFKIVDREDSIIKRFQRKEIHASAFNAYDEILSSGTSTAGLTVSQQPSFKATCLVDEIEYICDRSGHDAEGLWSPTLYVYVFRELVDTIHPALGDFHTCAVVRRIRILVSMAGEVALQDYPLEMALHSLRPFLTQSQCAEDVMGLFRYLFTHGAAYLELVPSFVAGLLISSLTSLRIFLDTPQDSTTQESDYRATMSKAQDFHSWIGAFATDYHPSALDEDSDHAFQAIVEAARKLRSAGNAKSGTYESDLLLELLKDRQSGRNLIDEPSHNLILDLLCRNFEVPSSYRDDILGNDEDAAACVPIVLKTIERKGGGTDYSIWGARVLGRAFAGKGYVDKGLTYEVDEQITDGAHSDSQTHHMSNSRREIIDKLSQLLLTDDLRDVGLSERALQMISTKAKNDASLRECVDSLPQTLTCALTWKPFSAPQPKCPRASPQSFTEAAQLEGGIPDQVWVQRTCSSLVNAFGKDPLLSELPLLIEAIKGLPEKIFPFVLHLALLLDPGKTGVKAIMTTAINQGFQNFHESIAGHSKHIINAILYLRTQPRPNESTKADRCHWLDIDYRSAAEVAAQCNMFKTALISLEISFSEEMQMKRSRRSSGVKYKTPVELLMRIFRNVDDKDLFYGIQQPSELSSMMDQLEFENPSFKALSFRGAYFDGEIRQDGAPKQESEVGVIKLLDTLELNGLSSSILSTINKQGSTSREAMFQTARKLERWDISSPSNDSTQAVTLFRAFQSIHDEADAEAVKASINSGFSMAAKSILNGKLAAADARRVLSTLAVLTEIEDVLTSRGPDQLHKTWRNMHVRDEWMLTHRYLTLSMHAIPEV